MDFYHPFIPDSFVSFRIEALMHARTLGRAATSAYYESARVFMHFIVVLFVVYGFNT